ncbi:MAG: DUF1343 domain-containing protein [Bdellovibrionales bacterium]|nr:DUF1343 domain-containing protein [Bdellovibrionales bacterium]
MFELGIESFIKEKKWQGRLEKSRLAFLGHQASVTQNLQHSLDLIPSHTPLKINCLIGPQHGFNSTRQANMITTEDKLTGSPWGESPRGTTIRKDKSKGFYLNKPSKSYTSTNNINPYPIFSLYSSKTRRLTKEMLSHFDVLIVDLQDVGCRVYTYLTTLFYVLEDCSSAGKEVWILDRPNPAGRKVEGSILNKKFISFVGAAPLPIRHGLTLAEAANWYCSLKKLNMKLEIIKMKGYQPEKEAWPDDLPWVLPSPNMVDEECARCYSGTVLLEGTKVSEARGTVFPLKAFGFPEMNTKNILESMAKIAPQWLTGCVLREEFFQPVFDKFQNQICSAIRIYAQDPFYKEQDFHPYRMVSLFLKCLKKHHPDFDWIAPPPYEYEYEKPPIDILSGDDFLRHWIADQSASIMELEEKLSADEKLWQEQMKKYLFY